MPPDSSADLETLASLLRDSGQYQVLTRLTHRDRYAADDGAPRCTALFVDVETTGLNPASDEIIELAIAPFEYGRTTGLIYTAAEPQTWLEEPKRGIPDRIVKLTGITNEMVRGTRIDDDAVKELVDRADLIIAHNAAFDRPFLEKRLAVFTSKPWGCSCYDIPWKDMGYASSNLEYLLYKHCGISLDGAHRAGADCEGGIRLLAQRHPTLDELTIATLLRNCRQGTVRVWAIGSPIEKNALLKEHDYRWSPGTDGQPKAWYRDQQVANVQAARAMGIEERAFLEKKIYERSAPQVRVRFLDAYVRYSGRGLNSGRELNV
ncbi:MAG: 3'-5' exonuclease [Gemmatimonadaceae bacterium]